MSYRCVLTFAFPFWECLRFFFHNKALHLTFINQYYVNLTFYIIDSRCQVELIAKGHNNWDKH